MNNWKNFYKHWAGVLILSFVIFALSWAVIIFLPGIQKFIVDWHANRVAELAYYNDKYGGKTVEETRSLFVDALKNGNTDLASKYFTLDKQEEWKKTLEEYKKNNLIDVLASESENNANMQFKKYPNGIWKIEGL